jgi:hypothetical protein
VIKAYPLILLRGTALDYERDRWGLVESDNPIPQVISSRTFDEYDWREMAALSRALERTEGNHPAHIQDLVPTHQHARSRQTRRLTSALEHLLERKTQSIIVRPGFDYSRRRLSQIHGIYPRVTGKLSHVHQL